MKRMKGWKILGMLLFVTALVCFGILAFIVTDTGGDMTSFIRTVPEKKSGKKEKLMTPIDGGNCIKQMQMYMLGFGCLGPILIIPYYKHRLEKMMTFICTVILRKNTHLPDVSIPEEQTEKIYRTA